VFPRQGRPILFIILQRIDCVFYLLARVEAAGLS
jgi:hypothetical protein